MPSTMVKQVVVVILALIGIIDAHWGTQLLGSVTTEVVTILVTLALAFLGFNEMRAAEMASRRVPPHS